MTDYGAYYVGCPVKYTAANTPAKHFKTRKPIAQGLLGHVLCYDLTEYDEGHSTTIKVQWSDGFIWSVHPKNLERL